MRTQSSLTRGELLEKRNEDIRKRFNELTQVQKLSYDWAMISLIEEFYLVERTLRVILRQ